MKDEADAVTPELPVVANWSTNDKKRIDPLWPFPWTIGTAPISWTPEQLEAMFYDPELPRPRAVKDKRGKVWTVLGVGYDHEHRAKGHHFNTWHKDHQDGLTTLAGPDAYSVTDGEYEAYLATHSNHATESAASPEKARVSNPGANYREREQIKRKAARWTAKLKAMPASERAFIRAALDSIDGGGGA